MASGLALALLVRFLLCSGFSLLLLTPPPPQPKLRASECPVLV